MASAKLLIVHLSIANMLQFLSRISTYIIPDLFGFCYPMTIPCKFPVMFLCISRRVSMLFTFFLGLFRLLKIKNQHYFIPKTNVLHLALAANWVCITCVCLPYIILIPGNRQSTKNITEECDCSFIDSLTDQDLVAKILDLVLGTVFLYLTVALMCFVSIWMVLLLLKHKKTVFVEGALNRTQTSRRDITAIKATLALLLCYVTCASLNSSLRIINNVAASTWQKIIAGIYSVISPVILGLGYPYFRKAICKKPYVCCHKSNAQQIMSIS